MQGDKVQDYIIVQIEQLLSDVIHRICGEIILKRNIQITLNNMLMNYLRYGSVLLLCSLIMGCNTTNTEWMHRGEWVYVNESMHEIQIIGVETYKYGDSDTFTVLQGETYIVNTWSDGAKDVSAESMPFPLEKAINGGCNIIIDGNITIQLEPYKGICDRNEYEVEKLGRAHYRFTYIITDETVDEILNNAGCKTPII